MKYSALLCSFLFLAGSLFAGDLWCDYEGGDGPGQGKKIVLVSGDEEYRSEEALPMLGKILAVHHGFDCRVIFPIDADTGIIDPKNQKNLPGLEALEDAELMIIATRFRQPPDEQMKHIDDYLKRGGAVLGMRTATHGFNMSGGKYVHYKNGFNPGDDAEKATWKGGFGRLVLGEKWISHHGSHKNESCLGIIAEDAAEHPIVRGLKPGSVWGPSDVYGVRLPLPGDSMPLVLGAVVKRKGAKDANDPYFGMRPSDHELVAGKKNDPMMPVAWTKSYTLPGGKNGQVFNTTMGAATDLVAEGSRRMVVNAVYHLTGLEVPEGGTKVDIVGEFEPTAYGFGTFQKGLKPDDFALKVPAETK